jgi:hypothetical protein
VNDEVKEMQRQRDNQLLRFGKIDKRVRWDLPIVGCFQRISTSSPASERFGIDHGLINHIKLTALDGA